MPTLFFDDDYCHAGASFDTHAKAALVADRVRHLEGVAMSSPTPATFEELADIHDAAYLAALRTGTPPALAGSNGFGWTAALRDGVLLTTGGARDAALTALATGGASGSLSSGLHHASTGSGNGFCTLNGLALGAVAARRAGAGRVLILDLDAHCGGGTADIISRFDGVEQVDVSVIGFDSYECRPDARLVMAGSTDYLDAVERSLAGVADPRSIELVIYNAGMDPHERAGGVAGITTATILDRERMVFDWTSSNGLPVAFVLAGGYARSGFDLGDVADLHALTIHAALAV